MNFGYNQFKENVMTITKARYEDLPKLYQIADKARTFAFIQNKDSLVESLFEAPNHIQELFSDASLALEYKIDPEIDEVYLVIRILTNLSVEEASERFERLRETWWLQKSMSLSENLLINLAFK